ncbi:MAG: CCA tRNA nucleotidyltransferase [Spirochaetaceae bacterium]
MAFTFRIPKRVEQFGGIFKEKGYSCYLVGGAVRNMVLGKKPVDYDFATDASPEEVMRLFKRVIPTGIRHGTVTVLFGNRRFEVTTFRVEGTYSNARHPDKITFTSSIEEDLSRRDFTINAMALKVPGGELIDLFGGQKDLKKRVIRSVGPARERLEEDALRMVRACRFSAQLDFKVDEELQQAIHLVAPNIFRVSAERIREELEKLLKTVSPSIGFHEMEETGLLERILPELAACRGIPQGDFHSFDVLDHSLYACDGAPQERIEVRFAALLHDTGKAETFSRGDSEDIEGRPTFYHHEELSEKLADKICRRLKFSNSSRQRICRLVRHHMFHYTEEWSDAAVRRFIARVGPDLIDDLFILRLADKYGMHLKHSADPLLDQFRRRIEEVLNKNQALTAKDLAVNGHILEEEAGIPKGRDMGTVIDHLLETVLDDPSMNTKETLVDLAENFYTTYLNRD